MCKNSGFRSRIQKSYKKFGIESKNLIIFSESIPNLLPLGSHRSHRSHRLSLWVENLTDALLLCFQRLTQIQRDSTRRLFVEICGNLWQKKSLQKNICVIREIRGSKTSHEFGSFGVRLWVRQHFNSSRIYSNIDSIFFGVMTL